jgi:crotonobetainyl-CoA:carnitine CoA-transferase CaiB-like acyl-CoA transferase
MEAAGVPVSPIRTVDQVLQDPQVLANDMVIQVPDGDGNEVPLLGIPVKLRGTPGVPGNAPPKLGEHTDAVLRDLLGLDAAEIQALRDNGVV